MPVARRCCAYVSARAGASRSLTLTRLPRDPGAVQCKIGPALSSVANRSTRVVREAVDEPTSMIDLVFGVRGNRMPADYRFALWNVLRSTLPWVEQEAATGIVGIRLTQTGEASALLARRAKLTLRVPSNRVAAAQRIEGMRIDFGSDSIEITFAYSRALVPASTIYAQLVVLGTEDETAFGQALAEELAHQAVAAQHILGRRKSLRAGPRELVGYPVVLHGCSAEQSLRVQQLGLGAERGLGCGIFVPHKKIGGIE